MHGVWRERGRREVQVFAELESSKYQLAEYRLSIYGRKRSEVRLRYMPMLGAPKLGTGLHIFVTHCALVPGIAS